MEPIPNPRGFSLRKLPVRRHPPVTRLQSVVPAKVCRGNLEFSGSLLEDELPQQYAAGRHNWRIREHRSKKLGAKAQPTSNCAAGTEHVAGLNIRLQ